MFVFEYRALLEKKRKLLCAIGSAVVAVELEDSQGCLARHMDLLTFAEAMLCLRRLSITEMPICTAKSQRIESVERGSGRSMPGWRWGRTSDVNTSCTWVLVPSLSGAEVGCGGGFTTPFSGAAAGVSVEDMALMC